jgi:hypothetical protein
MQRPDKNTWNMYLKQLKHFEHRLKTYVYYHCNIWNILGLLLQHSDETLKHKSEMLETRRRRWPWPTLWGTTIANQLRFKGMSRATAGDLLVALCTPWPQRARWMGRGGGRLTRRGMGHGAAWQSRRADDNGRKWGKRSRVEERTLPVGPIDTQA